MRDHLEQLRQKHIFRTHCQRQSAVDVETVIDGQALINFSSNNYLGLANHPKVILALQDAANEAGVGSGSATLLGGYHRYHHELEEALAEFLNRQRVLLFNTGYTQNLGVISALVQRKDHVFADRLCHGSLLDGIQLSRAQMTRYRHLNMSDLSKRLNTETGKKKFIVSDSVFSMDGDTAPIDTLIHLANRSSATLIIDDAHGFGVLGEQGRGVLNAQNNHQLPWVTGTCGKALGTYGGFISGTHDNIEYLIQHARSYILTTAMPAALAHATHCALKILQDESWRRERLHQLIRYFRHAAKSLSLPLMDSITPIQPILLGDAKLTLRISDLLKRNGYYIAAIRPPTVAMNHARLRVNLTANHTEAQIDAMLETLKNLLEHEKEHTHIQTERNCGFL